MGARGRVASLVVASVGPLALALSGGAAAATDLQQTMPVVWVMTIFSVAGAAVTFGVLAWALWKFRDPSTKGRRYG